MIPALALVSGLLLSSCQTQTQLPPPPPLAGEVDINIGKSFPIESAYYDVARTISVVLPMGYHDTEQEYPVLYLIDGGVHQDLIPMAGMAALATLSGQYREFILVGVQTNERHYELTTESEIPFDLKNIPHNGGAEDFRQHLVTEVMPLIDQRYRTSGETALIGESLAGLFIAETMLRAPNSFGHYIAVSPSLWWNDMELGRSAGELLVKMDDSRPHSLYLTIASEGGTMSQGMDRLVEALKNHAPENLQWRFEPMTHEEHSTIYNPATLQALRWIFAPD